MGASGYAGNQYDAGVIRLDNAGSTAVTVSDVAVTLGSHHYDLWGSNTVAAFGTLILTQTATDNFDTSDTTTGGCSQSGLGADIQVTAGGLALHYIDSAQTLNTGGVDPFECVNGNESRGWTQAPLTATRTASEQFGGGNAGETASTPCTAGDPVNCATGNFFETTTDLAVGGRGPALAFTRTYNALAAASETSPDALGWGWTDSYATSLTVDGSTGIATVRLGNGATVPFYPAANQTFIASAQVTASLVQDPAGTYTFTTAGQISYVFSAAGVLTQISDEAGSTETLAYLGAKLATVTGASGRTLNFGYDSAGRLSTITDDAARQTDYNYDSNANLTSVTDASGAVSTFGYDGTHRLVSMSNANGGLTSNVYDSTNRITRQSDPAGRVTTWSYAGLTTTITDPLGHVRVESFDTSGHLTALTRGFGTPEAATSTYVLQPGTGNVAAVTDPNGHVSTFGWDSHGHMTSHTDALRQTSQASYDSHGHMISSTDPVGNITTMTYDGFGQLNSTTAVLTSTGQQASTRYAYDPTHHGDLTTVTDPMGHIAHFGYDSAGDRVSASTPSGKTTRSSFNTIGQLTTSISPRGTAAGADPAQFATVYSYDADGRPTTVTDPLGHTTTTTYDLVGNVVQVSDGNHHTTTTAYDADNEIIEVHKLNATVTLRSYDAAGNIISQTDGRGKITTYGYDALDQVRIVADPLGRHTRYDYDKAGNQITLTDNTGQTTTLTYDVANQLVGRSYSDASTPSITYSYDADGRRIRMTDGGTAAATYSYDSLGRLTGAIDSTGRIQTYAYDLADHQVTQTYSPAGLLPSSRAISRQYNDDGQMSAVTDWLAHTTTFTYDDNANLATITRPDASVSTYTYDGANQITNIADVGATGSVLNLPYTHDAANQISSANPLATSPALPRAYGYDQANRLTTETDTTTATSLNRYSYDPADELATITSPTNTVTQSFDNGGQLTAASTAVNGVTASTTTFGYDTLGRRTSATTLSAPANTTVVRSAYGYDQAGHLTSYTRPPNAAVNAQAGTNIASVALTYNGDGLRSDLVWDMTTPIPTILVDGLLNIYITGPNGMVVEHVIDNTIARYYHLDALGSTRALTDQNGRTLARFDYTPYGKTLIQAGALLTSIMYAGQYTDLNLDGLIYMRNRYYDPTTGQFLTPDPLQALTHTPYAYADNNPINNTDPTGLCTWYNPICGVSAAANAVGGFVYDNAGTLSTIASGLATVAYAGCAFTEGLGCGVGLALSGASTALSGVNTYRACLGGAGGCTAAATSFGIGLITTGLGIGAQSRLGGAIEGMPNSYARDIYLARLAGVVGAVGNGLSAAAGLLVSYWPYGSATSSPACPA